MRSRAARSPRLRPRPPPPHAQRGERCPQCSARRSERRFAAPRGTRGRARSRACARRRRRARPPPSSRAQAGRRRRLPRETRHRARTRPRRSRTHPRGAASTQQRWLRAASADCIRDARRMPPVNALRVERDSSVLRITLARPERRNAFDAQVIAELSEAFVDVGRASAVVLAGEGASFCAGADVEWMRASVGLSLDENVADANAMRQMFEAIDRCPAPVVARVQGHALGGGAGLVAAADIAIADPATVFAFSEVKLGIIPAVISPFALAKIGAGAARRYFVTGERFDAETALRIGLVSEVAEQLDAAVEHVVAELLSAGPHAARWAKRLVRERPDGPETARWIAERRASEEGQEGLQAFLEKRPAKQRDGSAWGVYAAGESESTETSQD